MLSLSHVFHGPRHPLTGSALTTQPPAEPRTLVYCPLHGDQADGRTTCAECGRAVIDKRAEYPPRRCKGLNP